MRHDIRVEKILEPQPGKRYPTCTAGARSAPPEDCGGPQAFLALRQHNPVVVTLGRISEILAELFELPDDQVGGYLGEHRDEMIALHRWAGIDQFDRTALNRSLDGLAELGGPRS